MCTSVHAKLSCFLSDASLDHSQKELQGRDQVFDLAGA